MDWRSNWNELLVALVHVYLCDVKMNMDKAWFKMKMTKSALEWFGIKHEQQLIIFMNYMGLNFDKEYGD